MMNVLLLGGTGFLGRWLVQGAPGSVPREQIFTVGRRARPEAPPGTHLQADLLHPGAVEDAVTQAAPGVVFVLAGSRRAPPEEMLALHVGVTVRLLRAVRKGATRVVVVGSSAELGASDGRRTPLAEDAPLAPMTPYGYAKAAQSAVAATWEEVHPVVRARLFNLIGPGLSDGLIPADLARQVVAVERAGAGAVSVGRTDSVRDFLDVRDAVEALWSLALGTDTGLFHIGSGRGTRIEELTRHFLAEAKAPCRLVPRADPPSPLDVDWQVASIRKVQERTGWWPRIPLAQSVRDELHILRG
jgi:GDP-4-dehydro-6-deoxy-D-mannose reductase